ncbi:hypothetical protein [Nannocystis pusilla]|uniref:hypothetical protein n=1 Tax=Nannocystis pusilla TaxID=889268 RepID=UPI003B79202A
MTLELVVLRDDEADPGAPGIDGEWQGPLAWQRRRGETLVSYFRGVARRAAPIVSPDGTATTATRVLPGLRADTDEATAWAVVSPLDERTRGTLVFVDGGLARFVPDSEREFYVSSFELALAGSIDVALAVSALDFARALCGALGDVVWLGPAGARFDCSRSGGAFWWPSCAVAGSASPNSLSAWKRGSSAPTWLQRSRRSAGARVLRPIELQTAPGWMPCWRSGSPGLRATCRRGLIPGPASPSSPATPRRMDLHRAHAKRCKCGWRSPRE